MKKREIPKETIERLPLYLRCVNRLVEEGEENVSSRTLARRLKLNPAQIRKDLSYFGDFGTRGVGYGTRKLASAVRSILNLDRRWEMVLVGAGNIGSALLTYGGFEERGFKITRAFDKDPSLIGTKIGGVKIEDAAHLKDRLEETQIELAILAVPSTNAQDVAQELVAGGIKLVLNFAPVLLNLPERIKVTQVDIAMELEKLVYYSQGQEEG